jgi:hypothetical protein
MGNELQKFNGPEDRHLPAEIKNAALPALIMRTGEKGAYRFLEFFAANIRNPNTRAAYYRNAAYAGIVRYPLRAYCRIY